MYEIAANCAEHLVDDLKVTSLKAGEDFAGKSSTEPIESCGVNLIDSEFLVDLNEILEDGTRFDSLSISEPSLLEKYRDENHADDTKVKPKGDSSRGSRKSHLKSEATNEVSVAKLSLVAGSTFDENDSISLPAQASKNIHGCKKKNKAKEYRYPVPTEKSVNEACEDKKDSLSASSDKHIERKQFNVGSLQAFL
ncbi:transcriptional regulator [Perkinsela sp. CCAP 1560/4]|nr:transcriptional regulator [Perkinsela sp. CCAP 1560/4]|eukprot:KNH09381.1 transcriptional regulator [Perkinsela sp. CCAP 1560/4]